VNESTFHVIRAGGFVGAVAFAALLQRMAPHAGLRGHLRANLGLWIVDAAITGLVCGACACTVARWASARGVGLLHWSGASSWAAVPATVIVLDLVSYGWHRANHRVAWLWRFHRVHHSDTAFTATTAARFHPGELLLSLPVRLAAVVAIGATPEAVVAFEILFGVANFFEHSDADLPATFEHRLALVCVTPAIHRWHHSRRPAELDSNFATIFTLWDRLGGTYQASASSVVVETGLPGVAGERQWTLGELLRLPLTD